MILTFNHLRLDGVCVRMPALAVDNLQQLSALVGASEAAKLVSTLGVSSLRRDPTLTPLDLALAASRDVLAATLTDSAEISAVVAVSFTGKKSMPAMACQLQAKLGLKAELPAMDITHACSGYVYGLMVAAGLAQSTQGKVLLVDADVQSSYLDVKDKSTLAVLADAGTASIVSYDAEASDEWRFAFLTEGDSAAALELGRTGFIRMDGMAVFKFVATHVKEFLLEFMHSTGNGIKYFVGHQANGYMVRSLASALGFGAEQVLISVDRYGNSASASVPVTLADAALSTAGGLVGDALLAGYGGGLSAGAVRLKLDAATRYDIKFGLS